MKRQSHSPESNRDPESVAAEARAQVERSLKRLDFEPAVPGFFDRIQKLAATLVLWGARMNLTARPSDPTEIAFHVADSLMPLVLAEREAGAQLRDAFAAGRRALDLGSGAGFPGLVLAAASKAAFTLCESRRKRASFLSVAVAEMGLDNVTVIAQRTGAGSFRADFDAVTARAIGDLRGFYRIAASALRRARIAIVYATPSQRLELASARAASLIPCGRLEYEVERAGGSVKRVLALWRKQ